MNVLGQPIGFPVPDWTPCSWPPREPMEGRFCRLEPLDADLHAAELFAAYRRDTEDRMWTYLASGPFEKLEDLEEFLRRNSRLEDPQFYAIVDPASERAVGSGSYLRMAPEHGSIEVGWLAYSPALQRTPAATEAMYLMMRRVFDELGYRRYEWKCDSLNQPSRRAAERLGFKFEGIFRQMVVYKGRNRDTAWYSILDSEWPALKRAFEAWLDPSNFDPQGCQLRPLREFQEQPE